MSTDKGGSKQVSTSYTPEQRQWLSKALNIYGPTLGQGEKIFQGERVAPLTETQTKATDVQGFLDRFAPYRDMPMFGETGTALSGILSGTTGADYITPEATGKYFKGAIEDPARKEYRENVLPAIRESFAGPGFWSGARANEQAESAQDLADWLGTQRAGLEWDVLQSNRAIDEAKAGRALSAIGPGIQYSQAPTQEALSRLAGKAGAFELASVPQQQRQAEINATIQKFQEEGRITSQEDLNILMALLNMNYSSGVASNEPPGLGYVALSNMLGSAGKSFGTELGSNWF